jgi:hypothetical protein
MMVIGDLPVDIQMLIQRLPASQILREWITQKLNRSVPFEINTTELWTVYLQPVDKIELISGGVTEYSANKMASRITVTPPVMDRDIVARRQRLVTDSLEKIVQVSSPFQLTIGMRRHYEGPVTLLLSPSDVVKIVTEQRKNSKHYLSGLIEKKLLREPIRAFRERGNYCNSIITNIRIGYPEPFWGENRSQVIDCTLSDEDLHWATG